MGLDKIRLVHSPLTDTIFLARFGKDASLALEKRKAEADVMTVLVDHMMHDAPKGSEKIISLNGKKYTVRVTPTAAPESPQAADHTPQSPAVAPGSK